MSVSDSRDPHALERLAARLDVRHLQKDEPLGPYTTFKIGGPADLLFEATSADALANAVLAARLRAVLTRHRSLLSVPADQYPRCPIVNRPRGRRDRSRTQRNEPKEK